MGMYAPGPGAINYGNVAIGNLLVGNGLPGMAMHNHASVPGAPPITFRDNSVVGNRFRGNGADTEDAATAGPTGINVYSVLPLTGIVITNRMLGRKCRLTSTSSRRSPSASARWAKPLSTEH